MGNDVLLRCGGCGSILGTVSDEAISIKHKRRSVRIIRNRHAVMMDIVCERCREKNDYSIGGIIQGEKRFP